MLFFYLWRYFSGNLKNPSRSGLNLNLSLMRVFRILYHVAFIGWYFLVVEVYDECNLYHVTYTLLKIFVMFLLRTPSSFPGYGGLVF